MKKIFILIVAVLATSSITIEGLVAQTTTTIQQAAPTPMALDEKTQKKVDKAKADILKDQKSLAKAEEDYKKGIAKYEKNKSKGKLSPDDEMKEQKAKENAEKNMAKLKKSIADNQAILDKYKQ
jgi:hypothetical protein